MKIKVFLTILVCLFLVSPMSLQASEFKGTSVEADNEVIIENCERMSDSVIDSMLIEETEKYLEETIPGYVESKKMKARPTYKTVYGAAKDVTIGGFAGN